MSNRDRVLRYLRSIHPRQATNAGILAAPQVGPYLQVFQITSALRKEGLITAARHGREGSFAAKSVDASLPVPVHRPTQLPPPLPVHKTTQLPSPLPVIGAERSSAPPGMAPARFATLARQQFSAYFAKPLQSGSLLKECSFFMGDDDQNTELQ